jgi:hypothetical protein
MFFMAVSELDENINRKAFRYSGMDVLQILPGKQSPAVLDRGASQRELAEGEFDIHLRIDTAFLTEWYDHDRWNSGCPRLRKLSDSVDPFLKFPHARHCNDAAGCQFLHEFQRQRSSRGNAHRLIAEVEGPAAQPIYLAGGVTFGAFQAPRLHFRLASRAVAQAM